MRVSASLGLVVLLGLFASCVQRTDRCLLKGTDFQCPADQFCKPVGDPEVGQCVTSECTPSMNPSGCSPDLPVCSAQGRCVGCDPTNLTQCSTLYSAKPFCVAAKCVACDAVTNQGCESDPLHPACDSTTNTCRACALHSECPSKVCVKDNTLSGLPAGKALSQGMCVPKTRVLTVDEKTCGASCTLQAEVNLASVDSPYVLVNNYSNSSPGQLTIKPIAGLPELHIVTSTADLSPPNLPAVKAFITYYNTMAAALTVTQSSSVTIEGLTILSSATGVLCDSGAVPALTSVKLIRSLLGLNDLAIQTTAKCQLTLDQTWIGTGPGTLGATVGGNSLAMNLDSTQFDIINSVFLHNYNGTTFGGITVTDKLAQSPYGRIVNSTFYLQQGNIGNVLAISCPAPALAKKLTISNSLFLNSPFTAGRTYIDPSCRDASSLGYLATDESPAPGPGPGIVAGISDSLFKSVTMNAYDLHPVASAPASVVSGGIAPSFNNVVTPLVDMDGAPRGKTTVTIGAFEVAH